MAQNGKRAKKPERSWSYSTGERGKTRVRVFERVGRPGIWIDYTDEEGHRHREPLQPMTREQAEEEAKNISAKFQLGAARRLKEPKEEPKELTLGELFDIYEREVTPGKSAGVQSHDRRAMKLFLALWGGDRKPSTLSRRDWDAYITSRRAGRLAPEGVKPGRRVRDRAIEQDLKLLQAILNWATKAGDGNGAYLLERNPLKGLEAPSEAAPCRPILTRDQYGRVRAAAAAHSPRLECFVVAMWETGHRSASVRQLQWSDVDLERRRIHFRGDLDKIGLDHWNPLSDEAVAVLRRERLREPRLGWIFPSPRDEGKPLSSDAVKNLWVRLATAAKLPEGERFGWHSLRRAFANRLRRAPLKDLQDLGGWTTARTLLDVYLQNDEEAQREALEADKATPLTTTRAARR